MASSCQSQMSTMHPTSELHVGPLSKLGHLSVSACKQWKDEVHGSYAARSFSMRADVYIDTKLDRISLRFHQCLNSQVILAVQLYASALPGASV